MGDKYDDQTGAQLSAELVKRELPITGRVDDLRARLREDDEKRAQAPQDGSDPDSEGEETEADDVDVPEPREPVDYGAGAVVLTEGQARQLTAGEARVRQFTKHVSHLSVRKYCEGDRVTGIFDYPNALFLVLPYGVEITMEPEEDTSDGLQKLRAANDRLSAEKD